MIVVPSPWLPPVVGMPFAVGPSSLKLLTRMSPACRQPIVRGAVTIPYGFWSPIAGTVLASVVVVVNCEMNGGKPDPRAAAIAGVAAPAAPSATASAARRLTVMVIRPASLHR